MNSIRKILLVEDSRRDAELVRESFQRARLINPIDHCLDGEEAMAYLNREGKHASRLDELPLFVLLDLKMPKVDGLEVLKRIRATPTLASLPVVMMTSSREEQDLIRSYELGVNAYVVKPLDIAKFHECLEHLGSFWVAFNEPPARCAA
ncbi:MAG: response regulator [Phycisphaerales bacterium]